MTHGRQMAEWLTAKKVRNCHLEKDPGCVFKGQVPPGEGGELSLVGHCFTNMPDWSLLALRCGL